MSRFLGGLRICGAFPLLPAIALAFSPLPSGAREEQATITAEQLEFFDIEVFPVLKSNCFKCHGAEKKLKSDFRITSRAGLIKGGDIGPAINLADPGKSLLLEMLSYEEEDREMPPSGKLSEAQIAILTRWVEMGAPFNPEHEIHAPAGEDAADEDDPTIVSAKTMNFWAFRPVVAPETPAVDDPAWRKNPIDAFIYDRLGKTGLKPNGPAPKQALLRRAYFDLIGLAPSPEQVKAFLDDASADAFAKVVNELLSSPHYGEKWARHWLDLVRYAESNGYERDSVKPMAYGYRDYVIRAFNEDKPYDRFLSEQLAGDELDTVTPDSITATGYHRLGLWDDEPADRKLARYDYLDSIASLTSEVMLGLTVGCARCHDHKIDPIPTRDYYKFLAFFINVSPHGKGDTNLVEISSEEEKRRYEKRVAEKEAREAALHAELFAVEQRFRAALAKDPPTGVRIDTLPTSDMVEVRYRFYRDTWDTLPEFDDLRPETQGEVAHNYFTLKPASREDAMGMVFTGKLRVPADGRYTFTLVAKDGARLRVGNRIVSDQPKRGRTKTEGSVSLKKGLLPIRLDYFNADGPALLELAWSGPDFSGKPLTLGSDTGEATLLAGDSRESGQTWSYTTKRPRRRKWKELGYRADGAWKRGPGGFGQRGTPGSVVRTAWTTPEIWLRREFEVRAAPESLTLTIHQDDDAEIFLNGRPLRHFRESRSRYEEIDLGREAAQMLREGTNVLAIHCRNAEGGQYIDAGLKDTSGTQLTVDLIADHGVRLLGEKTRDRYFSLRDQLDKLRKEEIVLKSRKSMAVGERGRAKTHILRRGNPTMATDEVQPGFPSILAPPEPEITDLGETSGRRRALAEWIASKENKLTARVMVNRLWQHHFGRGIVRSTSNFGRIGDRPTHPLLLDWLAAEFMRHDWSLKEMHKTIMLSRAYRMSSAGNAAAEAEDPNNDLFWRFNMRRLTAEEIRDSMLALTGKLNVKQFGPSIFPELPPEVLATSSTGAGKWGTSSQEERSRRSVYIFIRRSLQDPMLKGFDFADTDSSCAVRFTTTVPTQALTMINGKFVNDQAEALARRLRREAPGNVRNQVERALLLAFSRQPTAREIEAGTQFVDKMRTRGGTTAETALDRFCLVVLNLNEFMFLD